MRHNNHTLANYLTSLAARETSPYQQIKPFKAAEMADVSCGDLEPVDERNGRNKYIRILYGRTGSHELGLFFPKTLHCLLRRMYDWKYLGETIHKRLSQLRIVRARRPIVKFSKGHKRNSHISRIC